MRVRGDRSTRQAIRHGVRAAARATANRFNAIFRERELILRSDGRVRYLRLTKALQVAASLFAICLLSWAFGMTAAWDFQRGVIDAKVGAIKDAEVAYGDLLDEILSYQEKVAAVTAKLREKHSHLVAQLGAEAVGDSMVGAATTGAGNASPEEGRRQKTSEARQVLRLQLAQIDIELEQMSETTNLLEGSLGEVKARLLRADQSGEMFERRGGTLQDQVRDLQDQLVKARARAARLDRLKRDSEESLRRSRESHGQVVAERSTLERRKRELENDLGASRARGDSLQTEVGKLAQELDTARDKVSTVVGHRAALQALVSRLETQLQDAETKIAGLEIDFSSVISRLEKTAADRAGEGGELLERNMPLNKRAQILLDQLSELQSTQETVLDQLRLRTAGNVDEAERVIEMAGLDLAQVIQRAGGQPDGKGGPLVASDPTDGAPADVVSPALAHTLSDVELHLARWEVLKSVLRSLPLIPPVDHYHIASHFGKRRDPFNGRWSVHHGIDLAGWAKAPVFSSAPGIVVYAGPKGRYGNMIEIDHGNGLRTRYAHLYKVTVKNGEKVGHRQKIGLLGNTGRSTGPHVHYEVLFNGRQYDPLKFIKAGRHVFKGPEAPVDTEADSGGKDSG